MKKGIIAQYSDYENALSVDVEFNVTNCFVDYKGDLTGIEGDVSIELNDGTKKLFSGQHDLNDYENDFGFTIKKLG